jgi:SAM-dependent methyltransferase
MSAAIRLYRMYKNLSSPDRFLMRQSISRFGQTVSHTKGFSRCVDVGSGTAPLKAAITRSLKVDHYYSIDIAPSDVTNVVSDACALPFADNSVDLILSSEVLQGIDDHKRALDEMVRILRPGGLIIVTFPFNFGECDFRDFRRWTLFGMSSELEQLGCSVNKADPRGGALLATVACWSSATFNLVPGGRKSWRAERSMKSYIHEIVLQFLKFPFLILGWVAVPLDKILPPLGFYVGGVVFATKTKGPVEP